MKKLISRKQRPARNASRRRFGLNMEALEQRTMLAVTATSDAYTVDEGSGFSTGVVLSDAVSLGAMWSRFEGITRTAPNNVYPDQTQLPTDWNDVGYDTANPSFLGHNNLGWVAPAPAPFHVGNVNALSGGTALSTANVSGGGALYVTTLYRTNFTGDAAATGLRGSLLCDDGCAVYVNGTLVNSLNVPNPVAAGDQSSGTGGEDNFVSWTADLATLGIVLTSDANNVFAVELHNAGTNSSDTGFDASLTLESPGGQANTRDNDTFAPETPGNIARTYYADFNDLMPEVTAATTGDVLDLDTQSIVIGTVTVDPVSGDFTYTPTDLDFNGEAFFQYVLVETDAGGATIIGSSIAGALFTVNSVNDLPTTQPDTYAGTEGQNITINSTAGALISTGDTWSYHDDLTNGQAASPLEAYPLDAGLNVWNSEAFDTASSDPVIGAWKTGPTPFEQGTIDGFSGPVTTLMGTSATNSTYLYRRTFEIAAGTAASIPALVYDFVADDAMVLYINGVEVDRANFNAAVGPLTPASLNGAAGAAGAAGNENYAQRIATLPAGLLHDGTNTIAVEVHQVNLTSSDTGFDLILYNPLGGVLSNDSDVDGPNALTVDLGSVDTTLLTHDGTAAGLPLGTIAMNADGTFTFNAIAGRAGTGTFTYQAFDGAGNAAPETVTISLTPIDDGPVTAVDDLGIAEFVTAEDTPLVIDAVSGPTGTLGVGVLANDTTPVGDENDPVTLNVVAQPTSGGTVVFDALNNGGFTYTPGANFVGTDTFTYEVDDGFTISNVATVTIEVTPVDDAPTAVEDNYIIDENETLNAASATATLFVARGSSWSYFDQLNNGLETNPNGTAENYPIDGLGRPWNDPDFDTATSDPAIGAWQTGNGLFAGPIDGLGPDGTTFLDGIDDAALPAGSNAVTTYLFLTSFNVADPTGINEIVTSTLADDGYVLYINGAEADRYLIDAGPVTTTTLANANGDESVYVPRRVDVTGLLVAGTNSVAVEVHQVNTTSSDVGFDMEIRYPGDGVIVNDTDPEGDAISNAQLVAASGPTNGTLDSFNPDGTFSYTPNAGFSGTDSFQYTVDSGVLTSLPGTVTITVVDVPGVLMANDDSYNVDVGGLLEVDNAANGVLANDVSEDGPAQVLIDPALINDTVDFPGVGTLIWTNAATVGTDRVGDGTFVFFATGVGPDQVNYVYTIIDPDGDTDTATMTINIGSTGNPFDVNGDTVVDLLDVAVIVDNFGATSGPSDVNGDGRVNYVDAIEVRNNATAPLSPAASAVVSRAADARAIDQAVARVSDVRTRLENRDVAPRLQARVRQIVRDRVSDARSHAGEAIDSVLTSLRARRSAARDKVASIVDQLFDS